MSDLLDVFAKAVRKALGPFNDEEQPVVVLVAGLRDEIDRLRGLLRESLDIPYMNGEDLIHLCSRIHAALAGAAVQPTAVPFPMGKFPECEADVSPTSDNGNDVL